MTGTEDELQAGRILNDYVLQAKIGEGGMGEVWIALQPTIYKKVAVKILSQDYSANPTVVARFVQEARALSTLRHRNLVDIFAFGELPSGRPYYIMEFLEGKSLGDTLHERGPLSFQEISKILEQTCRALQVIHDAGIIHRDLKPDNLFLVSEAGGDTFIKILDFGIAKVLKSSEKNITRTGNIIGTPGYMSPEQFEASKDIDQRADIYSLGVILFEMLTGEAPFHAPGEGFGSIVARQMTQDPPKPSSRARAKDVPEALDNFVIQLLSMDPAKRPSRCLDVFASFSQVSRQLPPERASVPSEAHPAPLAPTQEIVSPTINNTLAPKPKQESSPGDYYTAVSPKRSTSMKVIAVVAAGFAVGVSAVILWPRTPSEASLTTLAQSTSTSLPKAAQPASTAAPSLPTTPESPKTVLLQVGSEPSAASVFVNGEEKGKTLLSVEIPFSTTEVVLRVELAGFDIWEERFVPNATYRTNTALKKSKIKKTKTEAPPDPKETANPFGK